MDRREARLSVGVEVGGPLDAIEGPGWIRLADLDERSLRLIRNSRYASDAAGKPDQEFRT